MKKFLPKTSKNTDGFTLIELLVVIAIIAILSMIGLTVFSGVQKNARDAKRRGDVDAISTALEANYTQNSATPYHALSGTMFSGGVVPTDPTTQAAYTITGTLPGMTYCVCTSQALENGGGNFAAACAAGTTHYCMKNQQ